MKKILFLLLLISISSLGQESLNQKNKQIDISKNIGYFNITKVSFITMSSLRQERFIKGEGTIFTDLDTNGAHAWSIQTINGYFISPQFSLGIGLGLDGHHAPNYNTLPVFLDARLYHSEEENSLYSFLDIGPTLKLGGDNSTLRKGVLFNFGFGYKFNAGNRLHLIFDIFYSHKTVSLTNEGIGTSDNVLSSQMV